MFGVLSLVSKDAIATSTELFETLIIASGEELKKYYITKWGFEDWLAGYEWFDENLDNFSSAEFIAKSRSTNSFQSIFSQFYETGVGWVGIFVCLSLYNLFFCMFDIYKFPFNDWFYFVRNENSEAEAASSTQPMTIPSATNPATTLTSYSPQVH